MLETERKNCLAFLIFNFYFVLIVCFWGIKYTTFFFLRLSNGETPLIKIIIVKVLLMLIFFTNFIKFLYNFVDTSVTDFLKVTNNFDKTIIDLLLHN